MRGLVIYGNGDQARTAFMYLSKDSDHEVVAFTTSAKHIQSSKMHGLPVIAFEELKQNYPPVSYELFIAVGFRECNQLRAEIYETCLSAGYNLISYVCSRTSLWGDFSHGDNCFIADLVGIHAFVEIGNNVTISSGAMIGHDVRIGDHVFIGPGVVISGHVIIGDCTFIGANATLRNGIEIGERCIVGAGALIMNDVTAGQVLIPRPTKVLSIDSNMLSPFLGKRRSR